MKAAGLHRDLFRYVYGHCVERPIKSSVPIPPQVHQSSTILSLKSVRARSVRFLLLVGVSAF